MPDDAAVQKYKKEILKDDISTIEKSQGVPGVSKKSERPNWGPFW